MTVGEEEFEAVASMDGPAVQEVSQACAVAIELEVPLDVFPGKDPIRRREVLFPERLPARIVRAGQAVPARGGLKGVRPVLAP